MEDRTDEQAQEAAAAPPTPEEDLDLVALMDEGQVKERFFLPTGKNTVSDVYYIEAQRWTARDSRRYFGAGTEYRLPPEGKRNDRGGMLLNTVEQYKALVETSITDFHLKLNDREAKFTGLPSVWHVFAQLPAPVADWIVKTLKQFHRIEVVAAGEA